MTGENLTHLPAIQPVKPARVTHSTPPVASWWRWWRVLFALLAAALIACVAFVYRFNPLGGTLGGFDNDHFTALMRTEMLFHGERPLRDFPTRG